MTEWISPTTKRKALALEYKEQPEDGAGIFRLGSEYLMPCGCTIAKDCRTANFNAGSDAEKEKRRETMREHVDYWFASRVAWHDCARVTPETPSGTIPIQERKSRVGPFAYIFIEAAQTA